MPESERSTLIHYVASHPKLGIFLAAFVLRLSLVIFLGDMIPQSPDKAHRYDEIAQSLIRGEGFSINGKSTADSAPLYPSVLAGIYLLFGYSLQAVRIFLSLLDAAHCVLFYEISKKYFTERVPLLTAIVLMLSPFSIYSILVANTEIPFLFLNSLFIFCLTTALQNGMSRAFLWSGVVLGIATLCRAQTLLMPLFSAPAFVVRFKNNQKSAIGPFALFVFGFTLVIAPWIWRNYLAFGKFVPVQTLGGLHLYKSSPFDSRDEEIRKAQAKARKLNSIEKDGFYYRLAWENIRNNPGSSVSGWGRRLIKMWYRTDSQRYEGILQIVNGTLLLLSITGIILTRKSWKRFALLYSVILYFILINMVLGALVRYVFPILPLLMLFAMVPINELLKRIGSAEGFHRKDAKA